VLVTDGGTVVIGGVIQTQNSLSVSQVPCSAISRTLATCSSIAP
jgi:type II secretory pathway component HofQ